MKKNKSYSARLLDYPLKIVAFLIILEPIWMLLPLAGFLYGSVFDLQFLQNSYYTIWLLYFVFPVQTLMPFSLALSIAGFSIFIIGAIQIYSAKIRKSGLVKSGLYRIFRHPQYTGLVFFAVGLLLLWGRFIAYIAFFLMVFIYYFLARREEKICLDRFGTEYEDYMRTTYFFFPGERILAKSAGLFSSWIPRKPVRVLVSFVLLMSIGIGICFGILFIRSSAWKSIPFAAKEISTEADKKINLIMIKGFSHHVKGMKTSNPDKFYRDFLDSFAASNKIKRVLMKVGKEKYNTMLCFLISRTVRERKDYYQKGRGDIFVLLIDSPVDLNSDNFDIFRKSWKILGALEVNEFDQKKSGEPVKGKIVILKTRPGESRANFQKRMEGILNIYLTGLKATTFPFSNVLEKSYRGRLLGY